MSPNLALLATSSCLALHLGHCGSARLCAALAGSACCGQQTALATRANERMAAWQMESPRVAQDRLM
jgi:hypothetical protein